MQCACTHYTIKNRLVLFCFNTVYTGRMADIPTIFVAFGVTGDLMRLKILPALFALYSKGELPERFALLGVSRKDISNADLRALISDALVVFLQKGEKGTVDEEKLNSFLQSVFAVQGDATERPVYEKLEETFEALEHTWGSVADKILYLSISPTLYKGAFEQLRHAVFTQNTKQVRLMIEKPFGLSGKSADKLQSILQNTFEERAIYRVDHYLAKEALDHTPAIDGSLVSSIAITFFETDGVEKRGSFYDATGALLDVGQNHMLQMLAKVTMEHSRAEALEALHPLSASEVALKTSRTQDPAYKKIPGVPPNSKTETAFTITSYITTGTFENVTVTLEGGKYMPENKKEIVITFKDGRVITHPIGENTARSEYEILIGDCIKGNQTRFVSKRENAALWRFVDPILEQW